MRALSGCALDGGGTCSAEWTTGLNQDPALPSSAQSLCPRRLGTGERALAAERTVGSTKTAPRRRAPGRYAIDAGLSEERLKARGVDSRPYMVRDHNKRGLHRRPRTCRWRWNDRIAAGVEIPQEGGPRHRAARGPFPTMQPNQDARKPGALSRGPVQASPGPFAAERICGPSSKPRPGHLPLNVPAAPPPSLARAICRRTYLRPLLQASPGPFAAECTCGPSSKPRPGHLPPNVSAAPPPSLARAICR